MLKSIFCKNSILIFFYRLYDHDVNLLTVINVKYFMIKYISEIIYMSKRPDLREFVLVKNTMTTIDNSEEPKPKQAKVRY